MVILVPMNARSRTFDERPPIPALWNVTALANLLPESRTWALEDESNTPFETSEAFYPMSAELQNARSQLWRTKDVNVAWRVVPAAASEPACCVSLVVIVCLFVCLLFPCVFIVPSHMQHEPNLQNIWTVPLMFTQHLNCATHVHRTPELCHSCSQNILTVPLMFPHLDCATHVHTISELCHSCPQNIWTVPLMSTEHLNCALTSTVHLNCATRVHRTPELCPHVHRTPELCHPCSQNILTVPLMFTHLNCATRVHRTSELCHSCSQNTWTVPLMSTVHLNCATHVHLSHSRDRSPSWEAGSC